MSPTRLIRRFAGIFPKPFQDNPKQLDKIIPEMCNRRWCSCVARMELNDSDAVHAILYDEYKKCISNEPKTTIEWTKL